MSSPFGRYKILSEIGRGGMGIVYQAFDPKQKKLVAIKQLVLENIDPEKEQEFRDRFRREATTVQRLVHPNIVEVFDVAFDTDNYFYVMEFLEGHSLKRELELRGGKLSTQDFWPYLSQVAEALDFAHSMNVVHRDVKPDNIFILKDGRVKITDFGIARAVDYEETQLTKTGVMLGTLAYVSPEQLQDAKNVDHRADIFSLGVVTYEALAGQIPFTGDGIAATIVKIVSQEEKPLHILCPQVSVETSACVAKAMRKRARERYRSVKDYARDFFRSMAREGEVEFRHVSAASRTSEDLDALRPGEMLMSDNTMDEANAFRRMMEAGRRAEGLTISPAPISAQEVERARLVSTITTQGKEERPLHEPCAIAFKSGRLVVADSATRRLHVFSQDGRWVGDLGQLPDHKSRTRGGSVTKPSGIAIDGRGRIYVCDSNDHYIRVFDASGVFVRDFKNIHGHEGGLQGICLDSTGLLYVSDGDNGCLQVFQPELGAWMRKIGSKGEQEGQFKLPAGLSVDRLNQIYCVDYGLSRVTVLNKAGMVVRSFGKKGQGAGEFNLPRSIAVDAHDKIYVLDSLNHRVQVFGPTGDWHFSIGTRGDGPGQFIGPSDLSLDVDNNRLYVADKGNKRIQVFELCRT
ncbi:MAG TPA: protein kinase [Candidatus Obscuribacterales bacterium]